MDGYKIGDISSFLNASSTVDQKPANDLFAAAAPAVVAVEEVYAPKPDSVPGKRPKKNKSIEAEPEEPKFPQLSPEEQLEVNKRTLFVGNLPVGLKRKQLRKLFADFGKIQSLRFRSVAISDLKLGRKVCLKTNKINENATSKNAYIVFEHEECLDKALAKNGSVVNDLNIRVDKVVKSKKEVKEDTKNSIFLGNIPFAATDEDIRAALAQCGDIEYVRLLRDAKTNIGKGIGYVKFVDSAGVMFAMKIKDNVEVNGRKLRIQRCKSKLTLENTQKAKELKSKKNEESQNSFRGRKSKSSDKEVFAGKSLSHGARNLTLIEDPNQRLKSRCQNRNLIRKLIKLRRKEELLQLRGRKTSNDHDNCSKF
ncbi:RNA-binding protein 34-like [Bolinopsis microptera]|uniref:RNA-binding protein 34-like n=1 Tax=Bolinopsis microptera TaxID=2820187 RepID=UPI003078AC8A